MKVMRRAAIEHATLEEMAREGRRQYDREYRQRNKERIAEYQRNYWARKAERYRQQQPTKNE